MSDQPSPRSTRRAEGPAGATSPEPPETPETPEPSGAEDAPVGPAPRTAVIVAVLAVILVGAILLVAFVPRTVAEGGEGDAAWRLRVAPGFSTASIRLEGPDETVTASLSGRASLDETEVWQRASGRTGDGVATVDTIVVGPTPRDARSIRMTTDARGVGEAVITRVLWRRVHVAVIDEPATVTDLVAIGQDGQVLEVRAEVSSG